MAKTDVKHGKETDSKSVANGMMFVRKEDGVLFRVDDYDNTWASRYGVWCYELRSKRDYASGDGSEVILATTEELAERFVTTADFFASHGGIQNCKVIYRNGFVVYVTKKEA